MGGGGFLGENLMRNMGLYWVKSLCLTWGAFLDKNLMHNMGPFWVKILRLTWGPF